MRLIYLFSIHLYYGIARLLACFQPKAKLFIEGRKNLLEKIHQTIEPGIRPIWFHFASLGEFEQGRAVMEQIREEYPSYKIVVTFFSPSGYEARKNTPLADYVFYLPMDTPYNAKRFLATVNPHIAIFTKYEYWYYYFKELKEQDVPLYIISAIYRKDQVFFKPWGGFFRGILKNVSYFFVQNDESLQLLKSIGFKNAGKSGDTRFDRVHALVAAHQEVENLKVFSLYRPTIVAGSTWLADEKYLQRLLAASSDWKLIIAPHEVHEKRLDELSKLFPEALFLAEVDKSQAADLLARQVLIVDTIGMLSSLYYYGHITYLGGGFGAGIHNTLEAATYGKPVIFGPKYYKFQEAIDLIECGAAFSFSTFEELQEIFKNLQNEEKLAYASEQARTYVRQHVGATRIIMKYLRSQHLL